MRIVGNSERLVQSRKLMERREIRRSTVLLVHQLPYEHEIGMPHILHDSVPAIKEQVSLFYHFAAASLLRHRIRSLLL